MTLKLSVPISCNAGYGEEADFCYQFVMDIHGYAITDQMRDGIGANRRIEIEVYICEIVNGRFKCYAVGEVKGKADMTVAFGFIHIAVGQYNGIEGEC